jgi:CheY-specific phosphatase CheX
MKSHNLVDVLRGASTEVLETMFFAEAVSIDAEGAVHDNPLSCFLDFSGAETGTFTVAVDRAALRILCTAFYGDEDEPSLTQEEEMITELTNMLAGSTLSSYVPEHYCKLSSPSLCDFARHLKTSMPRAVDERKASVNLSVEDGLLSVSCCFRTAR